MNNTAKLLIENNFFQFKQDYRFTWTSGLKSPLYLDCRLISSIVNARKIIYKELALLIRNKFPTAEIILGISTGGIIPAAFVANYLNLPVGYIRSSSKGHGNKKQIEVLETTAKNVVLIEDVISTAKSSVSAINATKTCAFKVVGLASIFSYQLQLANARIAKAAIPVHTLTNIHELMDAYIKINDIATVEQKLIKKTIKQFLESINNQ